MKTHTVQHSSPVHKISWDLLPALLAAFSISLISFNPAVAQYTGGNNDGTSIWVALNQNVPCTGAPVAGTLTPSGTVSNICLGTSTTLNLTGYTNAVNTSFQWMTATSASGPWTAIPGANSNSYTTPPLIANTYYHVVITCNNSGLKDSSANTGFTFTAGYPVYASIPYLEGFENWGNGCVTGDKISSNNWTNFPSTGDASWRREDMGATAAWYTPTAYAAALAMEGLHSARHHSNVPTALNEGNLNLYVDASATTGNKDLSFWWRMNDTSSTNSDSLNVEMSTDGGVTFTNVARLGNASGPFATWNYASYNIATTSNTTVIRFRSKALTTYHDDVYIDAVRIVSPCSGPVNPGTASASDTAVCPGYTVDLYDTSYERTRTNILRMWEVSTNGGASFSAIPGSAQKDSMAVTVTASSQYRLRVICGPTGDTTYSNIVSVREVNSWTGASNSNWSNAGNWTCGVPTFTTDAIIPGGTPNSPVVDITSAAVRNLTINPNAILELSDTSKVLNIHGTITVNGTFDALPGTVGFMGSSPQTIPAGPYTNIIVDGGVKTLAGNVSVLGDLSINSGATLALTDTNTVVYIHRTITVSGSWTALPGGTIAFVGSSPQIIPAGLYTNLIVGGGGLKILGGDVSVEKGLTLTLGNIQLGMADLTFMGHDQASIIGGSIASHIITNGSGVLIQQGIGSTGRNDTAVFPVGTTATSYTPASIRNIGTTDDFKVRVIEHRYSGYVDDIFIDAFTTNSVDKTWLISEATAGGSNATVRLQWNATDELSGFDRTASIFGIFGDTGNDWITDGGSPRPASGTDPYSLSAANITSFSPFGVFGNTTPIFIGGSPRGLTVCQHTPSVNISSLLTASDPDASQTLTWTIITSPTHGTLLGFPGTMATLAPFYYNTANSYSGPDTFTIQVSDGHAAAQCTITVNVEGPVVNNTIVTDSQIICSAVPATTIDGSAATGGNGVVTYLWQISTVGETGPFTNAPGTNNDESYSPGSTIGWFRRQTTVGGVCYGGIPFNTPCGKISMLNATMTLVAPPALILNTNPGVCYATSSGLGTPIVSNNCGSVTITNNFLTNINFPTSLTVVTWTATDAASNTASDTQHVWVIDNQAPVVTCPGNQTLNTIPNTCAASYTIADPASDNCPGMEWGYSLTGATTGSASGIPDGTGSDVISFNKGVTTVTLSGTDGTNSAAGCSFTVTVNDNQPPDIMGCPGSVTVYTGPGRTTCNQTVSWTPPSAVDNCGPVTVSFSAIPGSAFPVGTTMVTYTFTDASNNSRTCGFYGSDHEQYVTVIDNTPPVITCPPNITHTADAGLCSYTTPVNTTTLLATDNCGNPVISSVRSDNQPLNAPFPVTNLNNGNPLPTITTITWTADDGHGNTSTCTQTVTITDNEKPVITCSPNISHTADPGLCSYHVLTTSTVDTFIKPPTVTDNCGGTPVLSRVRSDNQPFSTPYPVGITTITWTANDGRGNTSTCNQTVTITDIQAPAVSCKPYTASLTGGAVIVPAMAIENSSSDNCGIASKVVVPNTFTCANAGNSYPVVLSVTDVNGNSSSCTSTVTIPALHGCSIAVAPSSTVYTGGVANRLYLGYGPQSDTLKASPVGSGYSYSWSPSTYLSCTTCRTPVFTPATAGNYTYTVVVTNSSTGCSTHCSVTICVKDIRVSGNGNQSRVYVCHSGNTVPAMPNAVPGHLNNHGGDQLGECNNLTCNTNTRQAAAYVVGDDVKIYPNPNTGSFVVELPYIEDHAEITVTDVQGKVIERTVVTDKDGYKIRMDLGENARGMYFVEVVYGDNRVRTKVVVD